MMRFTMRYVTRGVAGAVLLMLAACNQSSEQQRVEAIRPLCLGIAYDVSRSAEPLPELTMGHLERLLRIMKTRGGCVAVALVDESAFKPLTRLKIETVKGRLDQRAEIAKRNRRAEEEFVTKVEAMLTRPRNAKRTDIKGAFARLGLFFGEPGIPAGAEKVFLIISDGIDTVHRQGLVGNSLPDDVTVYVVGMEKWRATQWFGEQAVLFESPEAAVDNLEERRS